MVGNLFSQTISDHTGVGKGWIIREITAKDPVNKKFKKMLARSGNSASFVAVLYDLNSERNC